MKILKINQNDSGQRVDKFIEKSLPNLPSALLYKYIRTKKIKVNRKRCEPGQKLVLGDEVIFFISDEFFITDDSMPYKSLVPRLDVVYEDENIIIVNKKVGMVVHSDENEEIDTLINHILAYLYIKKEYDPDAENSFTPALCNRIDRNTSGLVIAAKTAPALREMNDIIKYRKITKRYMCAAVGVFDKKEATLTAWLTKDSSENMVTVYKRPVENGKKIITAYRVVSEKNGLSLLDVDLITGRTHQIRAHLAFVGHPLVGDGKYGEVYKSRIKGQKHQALCSYCIKFDTCLGGTLDYLSGKTIKLDEEKIWFVGELFK